MAWDGWYSALSGGKNRLVIKMKMNKICMQVWLAGFNEHLPKTRCVPRTEKHFHTGFMKAWCLPFVVIVGLHIHEAWGLLGGPSDALL